MRQKRGREAEPRERGRYGHSMALPQGRAKRGGCGNNESSRFSSVAGDCTNQYPPSGHLRSAPTAHPSSREGERGEGDTFVYVDLTQDLAARDGSSGPGPEADHRRCSVIAQTPNDGCEVLQEQEEDERIPNFSRSRKMLLFLGSERYCRSEEHPPPDHRRRPVSLDFGIQGSAYASVSTPLSHIEGATMKKGSTVAASSESCTFPSPGAPDYRRSSAVGYARGWSSERAPLPLHNRGRRYGGGNSLFVPFGNVRALPSKWEDAERWILSPVCGEATGANDKAARPPHRRLPKSKSGPLGNAGGVGSYVMASPQLLGGSLASSPFLTGIVEANHDCGVGVTARGGGHPRSCGDGGDGGASSASRSEQCMARSASMNAWPELVDPSSFPASQDENSDRIKDAVQILPSVSTKDVGTQMSPCSSDHSFPWEKPLPWSPPEPESQSHSVELDVRDVQIHDRITITRWSKKHMIGGWDKDSSSIARWKKKTIESSCSAWKTAGTTECMAKSETEEANITAWENLQKAKAEAAIQKLETKLEKKRASSIERILRKLRAAQMRAEEMRKRVAAVPGKACDRQDVTTKVLSSLRGCFTCHVL